MSHTTGSIVRTSAEFATLPMGTLLVGTAGAHLGTSYRIHPALPGAEVTATSATGTTQTFSIEDAVRGNYDMGELSIVWLPAL